MAILRVPQDYSSVQAAVNAASPGDSIALSSSYAASESVTVGTDHLEFYGTSTASVQLTLSGVSVVHVGGHLNFSVVNDDDAASIYVDNHASNTVTGGNVSDRIYAGAGDTVRSGGGDDVIFVSGAPTLIDGGDGNDTVGVVRDVNFAAGSLVDVERINVASDVSAFFDAITSDLTIYSTSKAGGSTLVRGGSGDDTFYGSAGADRFVGNGGTDTFS